MRGTLVRTVWPVFGQQRGGEDRECRVLAAAQAHLAFEALSADGINFLQMRVLLHGALSPAVRYFIYRIERKPSHDRRSWFYLKFQYTRLGGQLSRVIQPVEQPPNAAGSIGGPNGKRH